MNMGHDIETGTDHSASAESYPSAVRSEYNETLQFSSGLHGVFDCAPASCRRVQ